MVVCSKWRGMCYLGRFTRTLIVSATTYGERDIWCKSHMLARKGGVWLPAVSKLTSGPQWSPGKTSILCDDGIINLTVRSISTED